MKILISNYFLNKVSCAWKPILCFAYYWCFQMYSVLGSWIPLDKILWDHKYTFSIHCILILVRKELNKTTTGRLNNGVPQVPPARSASDLESFRQTLPVYNMKEEIVKVINENKVLLISGETGSGKTTQVSTMCTVNYFQVICMICILFLKCQSKCQYHFTNSTFKSLH